MTIQDITSLLESFAPLNYQEDYDNSGLLTGDKHWQCNGVLISLDTTEAIIDEAIQNNCNLIVSHHPLIFRGLKKLTGTHFVERAIIKAIKNDIAIYAIHTNLDNVKAGVNKKIAEKLGLVNLEVLHGKGSTLKKLVTYAPQEKAEKIRQALFSAGGGQLGNYSDCSFNVDGIGTFKAGEGAHPFVGAVGKRHEEKETRIEVIFPAYLERKLLDSLISAHPYEEVAFDIYQLDNFSSNIGSGLVGSLPGPMSEAAFLELVSGTFLTKMLRHSQLREQQVASVAVCGGAGISFLPQAVARKADVFLTADVKYHEFFEAEGHLLLVDTGHFESEQFTIELLHDLLSGKFPNFAILKTGLNTNPVHYFGR